jgi:hypothetical protein
MKQLNNKGNASIEVALIIILVLAMGVTSIYAMQAFDEVNKDIQSDLDMHPEAKTVSGDLYNKYGSLMDNLILFALVLFTVFVVVSVFIIDTHPIFFWVNIVILVFVLIATMLLGNFFHETMTDPEIVVYANEFPYTSWLMNHAVMVALSIGLMVLIAMFLKFRSS